MSKFHSVWQTHITNMAYTYLTVFVLMLDVAMSDNQKRLAPLSDLDISSALHDITQELDSTKQENLAMKSQIAELYQYLTTQDNKKRLLLHSDLDVSSALNDTRQELNATKQENVALKSSMAQEILDLKAQLAHVNTNLRNQMTRENMALTAEIAHLTHSQGSTYVRWGRTVCPGNGTQKVYSGYTAGSSHLTTGGAATYVCLPETPSWAYYVDGIQNYGQIYGAEYQTVYASFDQHAFGKGMQDQDAPCVVCHSSRSATIMVPGSTLCFSGWTQEYTGYLMTGSAVHHAASDFACVDKDPEAVPHGEANLDGKLFYFTEAHCGSLPCKEYPQGRELACVVCSK